MYCASTKTVRPSVRRTNDGLTQSLGREKTESYFQLITVADRDLTFLDNLDSALRTLGKCPEGLRAWEWDYLMRLCRVEPVVIRDIREVASVSFSHDGKFIASAGADGFVKIWDSRTGQLARKPFPAHKGWAYCVAFHPAGTHVASAGEDGRFRVWDLSVEPPNEVFGERCDVAHMVGTAYARKSCASSRAGTC